ncbi:hypothetical protein F511_04242 [Dorcoceras hygrometricum]|nr:hypothetical protein F511_04242 [Dorcoceras hygrometricum]
MEDTDFVQMFESLIATGLKNFLGCPAVFNEAALTEFFANSSVREDGLVVSTVNGVTVEISEEVFSAMFELPVEGLTDLSEVPKNLVFDARSLFFVSKEQVKRTPTKKKGVTKKRPAAGDAEVAPIVKNKRTTKGKPVAAKRLPVEEPVGVSTTTEQPVTEVATGEREPVGGLIIASITEATIGDVDAAIEQVLAQLDIVIQDSDVERNFDVDNQELPVFDETRKVPEAGGSKSFGDDKAGEKAIGSTHSTEEHMSTDDLLMQISEDMMLPSVTAAELTKMIKERKTGKKMSCKRQIQHGKTVRDLYYASLPRISIDDKGKEKLEEDEPVRGNPAWETVELICVEVDFLVQLRNKVMPKKRPAAGDAEVAPIVKKKRTTKGKPVAAKRLPVEEPVGVSTTTEQPVTEVATGEREPVGGLIIASITEATIGDVDAAIEQVLAQLDLVIQDSDVERNFDVDNQELPVFDETRKVPEAGGSKSFGDDKAGEKAIGSTHSTEEHMSTDDLLMQISEDMMLPSVTAAELTKVRLAESLNIHEVQERDLYYASLPRISIDDKGKEKLEEDEPVRGNPAWETVELICVEVDFLVQLRNKVMQDVIEFFHSFSLNKLTDLDGFKALKAKESLMLNWAETDSLEMAVRRRVYILAKYRDMLLRNDSQMNFDTTDFPLDDTTEAQTSLPTATVEALDDLRAFILQLIDDSNSAILSKLHTLERGLRDALHDQDDNARKLINSVCQAAHTISDVQKIHLNDVKKIVLAQGVIAGVDSLAIRKEFKAIDAKINSLDGQVAAIRNEQLEFHTKIAADIMILSTQLGDIVDYIRGGDAKKGEGSSTRRPVPTHVHQSEGTGDAVRLMEPTQADIDNANREILERMRNEDSLRAEREKDRARRERRLSRIGAYKRRRGKSQVEQKMQSAVASIHQLQAISCCKQESRPAVDTTDGSAGVAEPAGA